MLLFAAEVVWLIIFSRFPMIFDEAYHFELIQFFSHRLNPIVLHESASLYNAGAIAHSPSVLYYYVLSFPFRIFAHITSTLSAQVIFLRVLNLLCALGTLFLLRKILLLMRVPRALTQATVVLFAFTPLYTVLAAEINYDNGMLLALCVAVYAALKFDLALRAKQLPFGLLTVVVLSCLLGTLVKYTFLPIGVTLLMLVAWRMHSTWKHTPGGWLPALRKSFFAVSLRVRVWCVAAMVLTVGLFAFFYGYNLVVFHNPVPQCNQVLSVEDCANYAPWARNYALEQAQIKNPKPHTLGAVSYTRLWLKTQIYQLYASVAPAAMRLVIPDGFYAALAVFALLGAACCAAAGRAVFKRWPAFGLLAGMSVVYVASLWARNFHDYLRFNQPVGVQGRYLLPVLMFAYAFVGVCAYQLYETSEHKHVLVKWARPAAATLAIAAFVYFGGYVRYSSISSPVAMWQHTISSVTLKTMSY
jgi:hypothetical protein